MARMFSFRSVFPRLFGASRKQTELATDWDAIVPYKPAIDPVSGKEYPDVNPLVEILINAQSDAERAQWLLNVPLSFVASRHSEINAALSGAGYHNGLTYLALLLSVLSQRRDDDGYHSRAMSHALDRAMVYVRIDARPDRALVQSSVIDRVLGGRPTPHGTSRHTGSEKA